MELFELHGNERKLINEYSKGMRKRVAMAAALIHRPQLYLMDEPFEGVDAVGARLMKDILLEQVRHGATIFLTSHVLEVVERLCDRVAIINEGARGARRIDGGAARGHPRRWKTRLCAWWASTGARKRSTGYEATEIRRARFCGRSGGPSAISIPRGGVAWTAVIGFMWYGFWIVVGGGGGAVDRESRPISR